MFASLPDAQTLRLCSTLASLAFAAVFFCVWRARRDQSYLVLWGLSSALYAVTLIAFDAQGSDRSVPVTCLFYAMLPASNVLLVAGVRRFHGLPPFRPWMVVPLATAIAGYLIRTLVAPAFAASMPLLMIFDTLGLAISMSIVALALLVDPASRETSGQRIAGTALLGYVPIYLLVIAIQIWSPTQTSLLSIIPVLSDQVLLGILNLGLLAMPGERAQHRLREAALCDPLTKAWNRDGLRAQQARLLRPGAAVVAIDLDRFKQINDSFGHAVGDQMLTTLAGLAHHLAAAEGGGIARLGGDEFVAVIPNPGIEGAQRFVSALQQAIRTGATHLPPWTVSLGMAKVFSGEETFEPALHRADLNLYRAKAGGRNRAAA